MKILIDLSAVIDLNRPVIIDATGVCLPSIIAVDWMALKWLSKNVHLDILISAHDLRLQFFKERIKANILTSYDENEYYDYRVLSRGERTIVYNNEMEVGFIPKHTYGQGLLAELRVFFDRIILERK